MLDVTETKWRVWDNELTYGDTLYRRAIGELPEMESSKKMAKEVAMVFTPGNSVCDIGCGAGHYLRSLERVLPVGFLYRGVDATANYVALAQKAFASRPNTDFLQSDIFDIDLPDSSQDVVMCNNVLLHLPSIARPLRELVRISRRHVLVRCLIGDRSFRIQDVHSQENGAEFDEMGEPIGFHFFNIYSEAYIKHIVEGIHEVKEWSIVRDREFDSKNIVSSVADHNGARDASFMMGEYQVNGYIMQPWSILKITI